MKCLICRNLTPTLAKCNSCKDNSNFEPKTEKDIVAEGLTVFNLKMAMPQYAAYLDNEKAQEHLLLDCIKEAKLRNQINTKSMGVIK